MFPVVLGQNKYIHKTNGQIQVIQELQKYYQHTFYKNLA